MGVGNRRFTRSLLVLVGALSAGCFSGDQKEESWTPARAGQGADLTPFQVEHGIGPITEPVVLGALDEELAEEGAEVFQIKCSACHKLAEKYVGPALGDVVTRRSPAFILNMILNPQEMYERHPAVKQLLAEHMSYMPNQGLTGDEAREVLEYLRAQSKDAAR
jgi:mono/diheme cytochrome c family protein